MPCRGRITGRTTIDNATAACLVRDSFIIGETQSGAVIEATIVIVCLVFGGLALIAYGLKHPTSFPGHFLMRLRLSRYYRLVSQLTTRPNPDEGERGDRDDDIYNDDDDDVDRGTFTRSTSVSDSVSNLEPGLF